MTPETSVVFNDGALAVSVELIIAKSANNIIVVVTVPVAEVNNNGCSFKLLGTIDTNQLRNHMAAICPNGHFIAAAAAAFTADVKAWEIMYFKDGSVKEIVKVMQLKGHKSAVTWLSFATNSEQVITA
ncbi:hypothetical protein Ancab_037146 [Ancistrocladus abbreviatus]